MSTTPTEDAMRWGDPKSRWPTSPKPCPVCKGTTEHVLGCPEQDKPR